MGEFIHRSRRLYYEIRGEGRPLLFLHGLGNDHRQGLDTIDAAEGRCLIVMDEQGHGRSDFCPEEMSFDSLGEDALALMDHLGWEKFWLAGISMGAGAALNAALRCPRRIEGLALIRPAWIDGPMEEPVRQLFTLLAACLPRENGRELFRQEEAVSAFAAGWPRAVASLEGLFDDAVNVRTSQKFAVMPACQPFEDLSALSRLTMPVLAAGCPGDPIHPWEYARWYADHIPGARLACLMPKSADPAAYHRELNAALSMLQGERAVCGFENF